MRLKNKEKNDGTKYSFKTFISKQKLFFILICLGLIVPIIALLCVFTKWFQDWSGIADFSGWASLVAGIATYIGAALFGVFSYYNSWVQALIQSEKEEIRYLIKPLADYNDGYFVPYKEDYIPKTNFITECFKKVSTKAKIDMNYLEIGITNTNPNANFRIKIIDIYRINSENEVENIDSFKVVSDDDLNYYIDYRKEIIVFIGVPNDLLIRDYYKEHDYSLWFLVLQIIDEKGKSSFVVIDYILGKTLGINKKVYSNTAYSNMMLKRGSPIVLTKSEEVFLKKHHLIEE